METKVNTLNVKIAKCHNNAKIPAYGKPGDMCCDIAAVDYHYDPVNDNFVYHTGLKFEIPEGYGMLLFPRSSNCTTEAYMTNHVGIIDSGYRGEVLVHFKNRHRNIKTPPYKIGDRVCQICVLPYPLLNWIEVKENELSETERGEGGHGSTGK